MRRAEQLRVQLADARGRKVVFLSHCLLNENVRYLGGAARASGVSEVVSRYLASGAGICQMPCPEQRAWGGVLKRRMLLAYGSGGTFRAPLARLLLRPFTWYTRCVYARLARVVARDVVDYRRSGIEVADLVGIGGSPSCGVRTTLDLRAAVGALTRCPAARLDRRALNEGIIAASVCPGEGLFIKELHRRLAAAGVSIPMREHDLLDELGIHPQPASAASNRRDGRTDAGSRETRKLMGVTDYSIPLTVACPFIAALVFCLGLLIGRGIRGLYRWTGLVSAWPALRMATGVSGGLAKSPSRLSSRRR